MSLTALSSDVYAANQPVGTFGEPEQTLLLAQLPASRFGRVRINMHDNDASTVHEMFIALCGGSYVHPHKHIGKCESFHMVLGSLQVVLFDDDGSIRDVVSLEPDRLRFYRLNAPIFHTVIVRSTSAIIHEVTDGPFDPALTIKASFAPDAANIAAVAEYTTSLLGNVARFERGS